VQEWNQEWDIRREWNEIYFISFTVADQDASRQLSRIHDVDGSYQSIEIVPWCPNWKNAVSILWRNSVWVQHPCSSTRGESWGEIFCHGHGGMWWNTYEDWMHGDSCEQWFCSFKKSVPGRKNWKDVSQTQTELCLVTFLGSQSLGSSGYVISPKRNSAKKPVSNCATKRQLS